MNALALVGLLALGAIVLGISACWLLADLQRFIAPDNADRDAINARHGEGTPEAKAALERRFGPGSHWRDAATGVTGLFGIVGVLWLWFG